MPQADVSFHISPAGGDQADLADAEEHHGRLERIHQEVERDDGPVRQCPRRSVRKAILNAVHCACRSGRATRDQPCGRSFQKRLKNTKSQIGLLMTDSPFTLARKQASQCGMGTTRIVPPFEPSDFPVRGFAGLDLARTRAWGRISANMCAQDKQYCVLVCPLPDVELPGKQECRMSAKTMVSSSRRIQSKPRLRRPLL